jgi:hypothetical protein
VVPLPIRLFYLQNEGLGHELRETLLLYLEGRPLYLEVGAVPVEGVGHFPRETSLYGSGCRAGGRGGTRPKGDPSTWKWVP